MNKSFPSAVAALTLGLTLAVGGVANAVVDDRPVKGTSDCTVLVNGQADVRSAAAQVRTATTNLDTAVRTTPVSDSNVRAARAALADAQDDLSRIVANVTNSLCKNGPVTPTTVVVPPTRTVVPAPTTVVERPTTVVERQAPILIRPESRVEVRTVVPTVDDGSVASTSGSQVTSVPEGSASTGSA